MINDNNRIIEENVKNQQSNQKEETIMNKEKVIKNSLLRQLKQDLNYADLLVVN